MGTCSATSCEVAVPLCDSCRWRLLTKCSRYKQKKSVCCGCCGLKDTVTTTPHHRVDVGKVLVARHAVQTRAAEIALNLQTKKKKKKI
jgi:hypothetical protein